jgi:ATP adenylyltransferase
MEYIGSAPSPGCLFCRALEAPTDQDRDNLVVHRADQAVVMLNKFPYNPGHVMVAPRLHTDSLTALDDERTIALMQQVRRSLRILESLMSPNGFNVGVNIGHEAGAGIPDHVHVHVVPRWAGDTNFMPVLADVKVVSEHLEQTWEKMSAAFAQGSGETEP